jgi:cell division protein FtsN
MASSGKKKNPFFSGFLVGLFVGLGLAVAVAVLVTRNNPFVEKGAEQDSGSSSPATPAEAPKYEFYQALPEGQPGSMPSAPAVAPVYFLQAGAYGNAADADQVKARLALLGFEAKILSAQEGETMLHKVRIGPYKSLDELNSARARLTQGGVETILVKIAPQQQEEKQ